MPGSKRIACCFCILVLLMSVTRNYCFSQAGPGQVDLSGEWKFKTGDDASWSKPDLSETDWGTIRSPGNWEQLGHENYDGIAWYRKLFTVPAAFNGKCVLSIGAVDDQDITYLNGVQVGESNIWDSERNYVIQPGILKPGADNIIAVRVNDTGGGGGIWRGPLSLRPFGLADKLSVKSTYAAGDSASGRVVLQLNNLTADELRDISLKYKISGNTGNELAKGEETVSSLGNSPVSREIKISHGANRKLGLSLEISSKDGGKLLVSKNLLTGYRVPGRDYLWLHADGKYIKTSPYSDPGNEIFVAAGVDIPGPVGQPDEVLEWVKNKKCNMVRLTFLSMPYPIGIAGRHKEPPPENKPADLVRVQMSLEQTISDYLDPLVEACIDKGVYCYLDQHEYFHRFDGTESWLPMGAQWTEADVQLWIDHWLKLALHYKDEPWVAAYELCNEPKDIPAEFAMESYIKCIKAVREVDDRHMFFIGNDNFSHVRTMDEVWAPVNFRPDEPYGQAVYVMHEYTNAENPDVVAPLIDWVQKKYNVPIFCTEFGFDDVVPDCTEEMKRQFEKDMFAMFKPRKIGWSIWRIQGGSPISYQGPRYFDIWEPEVIAQGSPIPVRGKNDVKLVPAKVACGASAFSIPADGASSCSIYAVVKDSSGNRVADASNKITFAVTSGNASLEGANPAVIENGRASITLKSGIKKGKVVITAGAEGLAPGTANMDLVKVKK